MKTSWLITALLAILIGVSTYWFYQNFSLLAETTEIGFQGDARYNPLLVAQRFLNSKITPALSMASLKGLPAINGTLVIPTQRYDLGSQQSQALLDWVRAGGHLIIIPANTAATGVKTAQDWLLKQLRVRTINNLASTQLPCTPVNVDIPQASDFMQVSFQPYKTLQSLSRNPGFDSMGTTAGHMLRYQLGKGYLTVLSDAGFMENGSIGHYDNAAFLWYLTHFQRQGEIWLIYSGDMPPLWQWLGTNAWTVLLSGFVLLVAWLWSSSYRLGPLRTVPSLARRRLLDHIEASGAFLWQHGQHMKLLYGSRTDLLQLLGSRHPTWVNQSPAMLAISLAELIKSTPAKIHKALFDPYSPNEYEFAEAISLLETIRKML